MAEARKYCAHCGKWIRPGAKDFGRRLYCSRTCYVAGSLQETNKIPTIRKRHQRAIKPEFNDGTSICFYCKKRRKCQRHHRNIANLNVLPVWACQPCHVKDDMQRKKWGRGAAPRKDGLTY